MNLSELLKNNLIEKFESNKEQIADEIEQADKNLASAKNMSKMGELDWSYVVAYTSMQHAGRALMFFKGYRPKGDTNIMLLLWTL